MGQAKGETARHQYRQPSSPADLPPPPQKKKKKTPCNIRKLHLIAFSLYVAGSRARKSPCRRGTVLFEDSSELQWDFVEGWV